jgi:hypothetical protein
VYYIIFLSVGMILLLVVPVVHPPRYDYVLVAFADGGMTTWLQ